MLLRLKTLELHLRREGSRKAAITALKYLGDHRKEEINPFLVIPRSWASEVLRKYMSVQ